MSISRATPPPTNRPANLPPDLLRELASRERLFLCLDYDGTLSQITTRPNEARPAPLARETLLALATYQERVQIAIVSGRDLGTLRELLGITRGLTLVGTHGLEVESRDGRRRFIGGAETSIPKIDKVRAFLKREIPRESGFIVEDKTVAIAMNYRNADSAQSSVLRRELRELVATLPGLRILEGNMVDEVLPRDAGGKGAAIRELEKSVERNAMRPVYFGDDITDEDAFLELRDRGITVLVGDRASWAQYRVAGPDEVIRALHTVLDALEGSGSS